MEYSTCLSPFLSLRALEKGRVTKNGRNTSSLFVGVFFFFTGLMWTVLTRWRGGRCRSPGGLKINGIIHIRICTFTTFVYNSTLYHMYERTLSPGYPKKQIHSATPPYAAATIRIRCYLSRLTWRTIKNMTYLASRLCKIWSSLPGSRIKPLVTLALLYHRRK